MIVCSTEGKWEQPLSHSDSKPIIVIFYICKTESVQSLVEPRILAIFERKFKMGPLLGAVCALHGYLNPIFLDGVLAELLFNPFLRVLCITM